MLLYLVHFMTFASKTSPIWQTESPVTVCYFMLCCSGEAFVFFNNFLHITWRCKQRTLSSSLSATNQICHKKNVPSLKHNWSTAIQWVQRITNNEESVMLIIPELSVSVRVSGVSRGWCEALEVKWYHKKMENIFGLVISRYTRHIVTTIVGAECTESIRVVNLSLSRGSGSRLISVMRVSFALALCCRFQTWHPCVQCSIWCSLRTPHRDNQILKFNWCFHGNAPPNGKRWGA